FGVVGACGHPSAHELVQQGAEPLVVVGSALGVLDRQPLAGLPPERVVVLTLDGTVARAAFPASLVIEGDPGTAFRQLVAMLAEQPFRVSPPVGYALRHFPPKLESAGRADDDTLLASEAIASVAAYLPADGHVLVDAGNCGASALHRLAVPRGTSVTVALGMGGMGYSLPGAVGAQLGRTSGRTVVLCGDGSFLMNGFEVHTAVDLRLPILYVVFNNHMHGTCVSRQRLLFDSRLECTRFSPVDVAAVARGFGADERLWVGSAGTAAALARGLADYHDNHADRPGLLELRLTREEVPPIVPFVRPDATTDVVRHTHRHGIPTRGERHGNSARHTRQPQQDPAAHHALRPGHSHDFP
ncbi:MAG TPA: thiamine pyrophosphate-dependent enzyme, partial [Pseudonocardiaceae bacterium]|nr:thiamine pyrophosphate-dependent enzyme [Pseudonocardiaceae bacterium]